MADETKFNRIQLSDTLAGLGTGPFENYLAHALCTGGSMRFDFNGRHFDFRQGDLLIVRKGKLIEHTACSDDFRVRVIYVEAGYIEHCTPQSNYGMKGQLALFMNPVMRLTPMQFDLCRRDFDNLEQRYAATDLPFHEEGVRCAMQMLIIDFFSFHASLYGESTHSSQYATIMNRFLAMLEDGVYRKHREVSHYASQICITPKYLSEVCKITSGHPANFWINRYTSLDISRLLRNKKLTIVEIADIFHFSSPAYFSRYVQRYLGMKPTDFRD